MIKRTEFIKIICFLKCCRDINKYNNLKRDEIKNMLFPKVKMVHKIQYGNYHGELSCYFGFKFLVSLSDGQQIVQTFDRRKNYNGLKVDGKICFRGDIDAFVRMHKLINLRNNINNELKWLQSQSLMPEGVVEIPENFLPEFVLILLEERDNACLKVTKVTLGS